MSTTAGGDGGGPTDCPPDCREPSFGGDPLPNGDSFNAFVAKLDPSGNLIMAAHRPGGRRTAI